MKKLQRILILIAVTAALFHEVAAQSIYISKHVVQFSGVTVSSEDLSPIPFSNVYIKGNTRRGTSADANGFFSFVALAGETVVFSSVGYMTTEYIIPDSIKADHYTIIHTMVQDTLLLSETVIYPWPSKEKFREAFLDLELPEQDADIIRRNFSLAEMRERASREKMDGSLNYRQLMQEKIDKLYYVGQVAPNNLLNPFAWAKFVQNWKAQKEQNEKQTSGNGYKDY